jgi:Family of unknown function (DUF5372)
LGFVTITHPHHPLRGQQLPVVNIRHGQNPDVIVCLPDGSHAAVALRDTDAAVTSAADLPAVPATHLLDLGGLRSLAQFIADFRQQGRFPGSG